MLSEKPEQLFLPNEHPLCDEGIEVVFWTQGVGVSGIRSVSAKEQSDGRYVISISDTTRRLTKKHTVGAYTSQKSKPLNAITLYPPPAPYLTAKAIENLMQFERVEYRPSSKHYCLLDDEQIITTENGEFYEWGGKLRRLTRLVGKNYRLFNEASGTTFTEVDWGKHQGKEVW